MKASIFTFVHRVLLLLTPALVLVVGSGSAAAQQYSVSVSNAPSGALLQFTVGASTRELCSISDDGIKIYYQTATFSSFQFVVGGTTYPLSGSATGHTFCSEMPPAPGVVLTLPSSYDPGDTCAITFLPIGIQSGTASLSCPAIQGYVNPKYLVVGVTYAPPGATSSVTFQNSTFVGNTESVTSSFSSNSTKTITVSRGFSIGKWINGTFGNTYSTSNSQQSTNSTSVTTSINVQNGEQTFGVPDSFNPVNHNWDIIWVWLNPVAVFTVTDNSVTWNGYGYEGADQNGMDIVGIPLGLINGALGPISSVPDIWNPIQRTWAANTEVFPAGQVPELTSTDLAQIATADPFSVSAYGPDYITNIPPSPSTSDGRFTVSACTGQASFDYDQGYPSQTPQISTCNLTYTSLTTLANSNTTTTSQTFATDIGLSQSFLAMFTEHLITSNTLTWSTTAQQSITNGTTLTDSLSIQGPNCGNTVPYQYPCNPVYDEDDTEPTQFYVYQDNVYGTFMYAPVQYYP